MKRPAFAAISLVFLVIPGCGTRAGDAGHAAPTPEDAPVNPRVNEAAADAANIQAAMGPYIDQARKTYPGAKQRYLDGLPSGDTFLVVTTVRDFNDTTVERVSVAVSSIRDGKITGRIASDVQMMRLKPGDPYTFNESDLVDWVITHPDGSAEGNVVGKFLDEVARSRR